MASCASRSSLYSASSVLASASSPASAPISRDCSSTVPSATPSGKRHSALRSKATHSTGLSLPEHSACISSSSGSKVGSPVHSDEADGTSAMWLGGAARCGIRLRGLLPQLRGSNTGLRLPVAQRSGKKATQQLAVIRHPCWNFKPTRYRSCSRRSGEMLETPSRAMNRGLVAHGVSEGPVLRAF